MKYIGLKAIGAGAVVLVLIVISDVSAGAPGETGGEFSSRQIFDVITTSAGKQYVATEKGLWLKTAPGEFRRYTIYDGLVSNRIYDLEEDGDGFLWIAGEGGLSILKNNGFVNFPIGAMYIDSAAVSLKWNNGVMTVTTFDGSVVELKAYNGEIVPKLMNMRPARYVLEDTESPTIEPGLNDRALEMLGEVLGDGEKAPYPVNYRRDVYGESGVESVFVAEDSLDDLRAMEEKNAPATTGRRTERRSSLLTTRNYIAIGAGVLILIFMIWYRKKTLLE